MMDTLRGWLLTCARRTPGLKKCVPPVRPENRLVFIGGKYDVAGLDAVVPEVYCDNTVTTTKYTPWNFLFKNLYEQFMRIANFYFLVVAVIMFAVPNTPVSPLTSALPLGFVLAVTAVKQAYEDWLRRREDKKVNERTFKIVEDDKLQTVLSCEIKVGDIVRVNDNQEFPCDLVLLSSSDTQGQCTIQTANLDGETNLKTFLCLSETKELDTPARLGTLRGVIDCQQPITDLYRFLGNLTVHDERGAQVTKALQAQNVLLRGAKLKNTDYIYGCAVYTGSDTKLALNSTIKSGKRSIIERRLNTFLIVFLVYMFVQCTLSTILRHVTLASVWKDPDGSRPQWYIPFIFDYSNNEGKATALQGFFDFLYFYIIYNYVIPISLYVTIELQKFVGSLFFSLDVQMYDEKIEERAKANTSDLNEELGQVEYLFCDKTGTLTENSMQFRQCSINGRLYIEEDGCFVRNHALEAQLNVEKAARDVQANKRVSSISPPATPSPLTVEVDFSGPVVAAAGLTCSKPAAEEVEDVVDGGNTTSFFEVLSLCHTVQIEMTNQTPTSGSASSCSSEDIHSKTSPMPGETIPPSIDFPTFNQGCDMVASAGIPIQTATKSLDDVDGTAYEYHASSPDEKALVEACRLFGVVYHGSLEKTLQVTFHGKKRQFVQHDILEFDSDRKCMSVIMETDQGEYQVLCKGAESSVLKKCIAGPIEETVEHVDYYASLGLRTLVIASKTITAQEFQRFTNLIESAKQDLTNRDEAMVRAYNEIEQGFTVIGATAVEDKLQEGVKDTIEKLRIAGIKVWVLTGDKEETAVNISYSAGHFDSSMALLGFTMQTSEADAYSNLLSLQDRFKALEREGNTKIALVVDGASLAMIMPRYSEHFRETCLKCAAVLCCRMTPIQKASVVKMVKASASKPTTAAIGDGANDVSMIQEAHVGIGIMGKEGRQAARSSDYAFGKFRFLLRTLLVHGHYYYIRLAILVQYFFYKNVAFITANFYFIFFSAYSAMSIFDTIFLTFYNVTFTSLPIFLYGLFEQHIPPTILLKDPQLYRRIQHNSSLKTGYFIAWNVAGLWHSVVASFGVYLIYLSHNEFGRNGMQTDITAYGSAIIFICSTIVNVKLMIETYYWTWITLAGYLITFIGNWSMIAIYSSRAAAFTTDTSMSGVLGVLFGSGTFWLTALLLILLGVLPDLVLRAYRDMTDPVYRSIVGSRSEGKLSDHVMFHSHEPVVKGQAGGIHDNGIVTISHRQVGESEKATPTNTNTDGGRINPALVIDDE